MSYTHKETTLVTYDTYDFSTDFTDTVWKLQPISELSSVIYYAPKKHTATVEQELVKSFIITKENVQHIDTRVKLEGMLSKFKIILDDYKFVVNDDDTVTVYGTGMTVTKRAPSKFTRKDYLEVS